MTVQISRPKISETQVATGDLDHRRGLPSPNRGNTASPIWVMHALLLASCGGGGGGGSSGTPPATNSMTGATTTSPTGTPSKGRDIMTGGTGNDVFELAGFTPDDPNRAQNDIRLSSYQETRAVVITDFAAGDRLKVPDGVTKVFITKNNHANTGRTATDGNDTNTKDTMIFNWKAEGTSRTELIAILEDYTGTLTGDDFVGTVTASYFSL